MMSDFWPLTYDDPIIWHEFEDDPSPIEEVPQSEELGVRITDLWKSFGDRGVLRSLSLDIEAGQFVSVVGRSGCGKSTLLRLIAGLETPDDGTIQTEADGNRGTIRIMFQESRLLPWASVIRNVDIGLAGDRNAGPVPSGEAGSCFRRSRGSCPRLAVGALRRAKATCGPRPRPDQPSRPALAR